MWTDDFKEKFRMERDGLRDLFFPRRCVVCGRFLNREEKDLCPDCTEELPLT